jgi:tetratricopeptide (TPR) repeat protein
MSLNGRELLRILPLVGLATLAGTAPAAHAVVQRQPAASAAKEAESQSARMLANALARLAIFDLRASSQPADADYHIASILLGLAREQCPDDTELLRRNIEAAWSAGDHDLVMELTRELLRLDPSDTVAQLRLITASIASGNQTAEQRLAAYEKFLGPDGKQFKAPIRSRLALDAALLLRERGDTQGFVDKLKQSLQLDPSHKEAAALAAAYFAERLPEDGVGRITLLQNLLMADPVDPNVHLSLARELAAGGAYKGALRFYRTALRIFQTGGGGQGDEVQLQAAVLQWHTAGPGSVVRDIRQQLTEQRSQAAQAIRRFGGGPLPAGVVKPEDIHLPANVGAVVLSAADASGAREGVRVIYQELQASIVQVLKDLQDPEKSANLDRAIVARATAGGVLEMHMARLWADIDADKVAPDMEKSPALREQFPEQSTAIDAWAKLRAGDAAAAIGTLRPLAETNLFAAIGLGQALEKAGQTSEAIKTYTRVVSDAPLTHYGAWARSRLLSLGEVVDAKQAGALERAAAAIPEWVDAMVTDPRQFLDVTITSARSNPEGTEAVPVRVTIQNLAPIPLGLGSDRTLNSRILLTPKFETRENIENPWIRPEIVDIDQRLRLLPREKLEVVVNPELGLTGWMMEALAGRTLRLRWRGTQGFILDQSGGFRPGVMCVVAESGPIVRRPLPEVGLGPEELLKQIATGMPAEMIRAAAAVRGLIMQPLLLPGELEAQLAGNPEAAKNFEQQRDQVLGVIAEVYATRYRELAPADRAALVALLPHAGISPAMKLFDDAARAEEHPLPLAVVLVTRVSKPDDPLLAAAGGSPDERIRRLAFHLAERLGAADTFYARVTPELLHATRQPQGAAR